MALGLLAALTVGVYRPALSGEFVYEDRNDLPMLTQPWTGLRAEVVRLAAVPIRAVTGFSFRLNTRLTGTDPWGYHVGNLILFVLCGLLVYGLGRRVLSVEGALVATAVFWLSPLQTEAVAYISGRSELLAALGLLVACACATAEPVRWEWAALTAFWGLFAIGAKEAAVSTILLVPLYVWLVDRGSWQRFWWLPMLTWLGLAASYGARLAPRAWPVDWASHSAQQVAAAWALLGLLVRPDLQTVDHDFLTLTWGAWAVVGSVVLLALAYVARRRCPLGWFVVAWVALCALPRVVMPSTEYLTEHHTLPMLVAVCWGLGGLWDRWARPQESSCVRSWLSLVSA